jgi:hypothetical protein
MTNLELLDYCKARPEPFYDPYYSKQDIRLIISSDAGKPNALQNANAIIRRNIIALEALGGKGEDAAEFKLAEGIVEALKQEGINNSEFTSYWVVKDVSFSIYQKMRKEDQCRFVLEMAKHYIQDRHGLYSHYGYSDSTLQVKADSFAHKRSGGQGQSKVLAMLKKFGLSHFTNTEFEVFRGLDDCVVLADAGGSSIFDQFVREYSLRFGWGPHHENKRPDFLVKRRGDYWVVEHKHMKEFGGGQNKQINEIIDFVGQSEEMPGVHYVSFLDGILFNRIFLGDGDPKVVAQRAKIIDHLGKHPQNYFVNTAGFAWLMQGDEMDSEAPSLMESPSEYRLRGSNSGGLE